MVETYLEAQRRRWEASLASEAYVTGTDPAALGTAAIEWSRLSASCSESSGYFFSRNLVSNETESLFVAEHLKALPPGLAYLGVGPETMLTYLGLVETPLAFIVDIRRDNARLHFLYRGAFSLARSRTEWLCLLLARPYDPAADPGPSATIEEILSVVAAIRPTEGSFTLAHGRILGAIERLPPCLLPFDRRGMERIHRLFWRHGLEISFQLGGLRLRHYPTLASLLSAATADGLKLGFLACEPTFRRIQQLENASSVVPVVGNVAGDVLGRVASELNRRKLQLGAIYLSNVEQYLFENGSWQAWVPRLGQLPCHPDAIIIRSYFQNEQGPVPDPPKSILGQLRRTIEVANQVRRNTGPLALHQMKTVVHRMQAFRDVEAREGYRSYRALVRDRRIAV